MRVQLFWPLFGAPKRFTSSQSTLSLNTASSENQNDITQRKRVIKYPKLWAVNAILPAPVLCKSLHDMSELKLFHFL